MMKKLYMILPLVLILCFMVGCQDKEAMAELETMKVQVKVESQNKALVQRILAEGDKKNLGILDEVCTPDYKFYFPSNAKPINREQHKELWQAFNVAFPDLTHNIKEIYANGDIVVARLILTGTHEGEFTGLPPTGKKVEFSAIEIFRFSDGKVADFWSDGDLLSLYKQLGMELKPK
ncbi:MAG: ester cyclase [Candidatus Heimdallarchaeota archaeon]